MNPYMPVSHHILSSVDIFWYICLLWDWLLIWQSVCPFLYLLIGLHPSVHCIAATDCRLGTTCCCLSYNTTCLDRWQSTTWPFMTMAWHGVYNCRVLEHHQSKMTRKDISYTDRGTSCKTDVREYSLIYLRYTDKS